MTAGPAFGGVMFLAAAAVATGERDDARQAEMTAALAGQPSRGNHFGPPAGR
jgi:hypothetical protein